MFLEIDSKNRIIVPPTPQVVPMGVGLTKSARPTFLPILAAALDAAWPPDPPPITKRSY
jgi:hypothetical protein